MPRHAEAWKLKRPLSQNEEDRGVAGGGVSLGAREPPLVGLLLSKSPTIFRWRKRHDNILAVKAIVMGLHAAIIRLSPLIHEGEQRYKPYIVGHIVGDPRVVRTIPPPSPF